MQRLIDNSFKIIGISEKYGVIEYEYPILSLQNKQEIMKYLGINYDNLEKKLTRVEIKVKYTKAESTLVRYRDYNPNDIFPYSIKELLLSKEQIIHIMNILIPDEYVEVDKDTIWKFCITKTIDEEFKK